ncbi:hypothetical protein SNEBB_007742 [Seison nebaliae]|nr:hypothetical protein SNEBB_007742 [Seison nebaliae]
MISLVTKFRMILLYIIFIFLVNCLGRKSVEIELHSTWNETNVIDEVMEYVRENYETFHWNYLRRLFQLNLSNDIDLEERYELVRSAFVDDVVSHEESAIGLFDMSMSLRIMSPRVEAKRKIYSSHQFLEELEDCEYVIDVGQERFCSLQQFLKWNEKNMVKEKPDIMRREIEYPSTDPDGILLILYGCYLSKTNEEIQQVFNHLQTSSTFHIIYRSKCLHSTDGINVGLSGFLTELAIKNTEYKAQDDSSINVNEDNEKEEEKLEEISGFNFKVLHQLHENEEMNLKQFGEHLKNEGKDLPELKPWQLQKLSYQTASIIKNSGRNPMELMLDLTSNFPMRALWISKRKLETKFEEDAKRLSKSLSHLTFTDGQNIAQGTSALFVNGIQFGSYDDRFQETEIDIFNFLHLLRRENEFFNDISQFPVEFSKIGELLQISGKKDEQKTPNRILFGQDDTKQENEFILNMMEAPVKWLNDLENDKKYSSWPTNYQIFLRQTFGGLKNIRRNVMNLFVIFDISSPSTKVWLNLMESFYVHNVPVRMGFILNQNEHENQENSLGAFRLFYWIAKEFSVKKSLTFFVDLYQSRSTDLSSQQLEINEMKNFFNTKFPNENFHDIVNSNEFDKDRYSIESWIVQSGIDVETEPFHQILLNGMLFSKEELNQIDQLEDILIMKIFNFYSKIQMMIYQGKLSERQQFLPRFYEISENVMKRINMRILDTAIQSYYLPFQSTSNQLEKTSNNIFDLYVHHYDELSKNDPMTKKERLNFLSSFLPYLGRYDILTQIYFPLTEWVVCNPETNDGIGLLRSVFNKVRSTKIARMSFIFSSVDDLTKENYLNRTLISRIVAVAIHTMPNTQAKTFINKLLKRATDIIGGKLSIESTLLSSMNPQEFIDQINAVPYEFFHIHQLFIRDIKSITGSKTSLSSFRAIISNGKIFGPFTSNEQFIEDDFSLLEQQFQSSKSFKICQKIKSWTNHNWKELSDYCMMFSSRILSYESVVDKRVNVQQRAIIKYPENNDAVIEIEESQKDKVSFHIHLIVNPSSNDAYKLTKLAQLVHQKMNAKISILFNCKERLSEIPIKSFYRFVINDAIEFTSNNVVKPKAQFDGLPEAALFTLSLKTPDAWVVEAKYSPYDLDNIHLQQLTSSGIYAQFQLAYLIIEGFVIDEKMRSHPTGLQFELRSQSGELFDETIAMINHGYFQLKSNPGEWSLNLREGRSSLIYGITRHVDEMMQISSSYDPKPKIIIDSFSLHSVQMFVTKKSGMENMNLLSTDTNDKTGNEGIGDYIDSIWSSLTNKEKKDTEKNSVIYADDANDQINIFSIASGHLYERFMRIMMLTVLKNTKTKVKFWFLKNYLSPTYIKFIDVYSKKYGFDYQFVSYKWPRWLLKQKEKQRIIWGYKILFLDVLFPLNIRRMIFVDADQIVRTDLRELRDLNLEGAAYGYTPFCDSRTEMEGYRFWKSGYWKNHLGHRKYHISALYVIDLKRFRQAAAGDRLRGQYQGLSQDPNSLSNLDQDLPNNMIHQVDMFSLPQEWLWCETWCSNASKKKAKTIDLCNNPMTKEPKLNAAKRIIPEWVDYDEEINTFYSKWAKKHLEDERQGDDANWKYTTTGIKFTSSEKNEL